jgi:hypothetical protein
MDPYIHLRADCPNEKETELAAFALRNPESIESKRV